MSYCPHLPTGILMSCLGLLMIATSGGCGSLRNGRDTSLPAEITATGQDELFLELHDADDQVFHLKAPFKESMFVQDALRESGAMRRYRRMNITLVRPLPNGQKLRMPVDYDVVNKSVTPSTNYSLHPNDTLEVAQDTTTAFERMFESAVGPLRIMSR